MLKKLMLSVCKHMIMKTESTVAHLQILIYRLKGIHKMKKTCLFFLFCLSSVFNIVQAQPANLSDARLDEIITKVMPAIETPGFAITVVRPDGSVYAKGFGVRELGRKKTVDADTYFGIGSVSKALTGTVLAILQEQGKLNLDDRVIDYIPEFRMFDPWVTREFSIRDLLTHQSGLPEMAGDLIFLAKENPSLSNVYKALANIEPETSFRTEFAYDNLLYIVAGDLIERVTGKTWHESVQELVLTPHGVKGCKPSHRQLSRSKKISSAHVYGEDGLIPTDEKLNKITDPAGGLWCTANGMAQWIKANIETFDEQSKVASLSDDTKRELWNPVAPLGITPFNDQPGQSNMSAYGLGWFVSDSYGEFNASHSGGLIGMGAFLTVFPESKFGVAIMVNSESGAGDVIVQQIVSDTLSGMRRDIFSEMMALERREGEEQMAPENMQEEPAYVKPRLPLESYAGIFQDPWFGQVTIALKNEQLIMDMGVDDLTGPLTSVGENTFIAKWNNRGWNADAYVQFVLATDGSIERMTMSAVSEETDPSFDFQHLNFRPVRESASLPAK